MLEQDKYFRTVLVFVLLNVSMLFSKDIHTPKNIYEKQKIEFLIDYLYSQFSFTSSKDKQTFLDNQHTVLHIYRDDCSIAYHDIGSHNAFLTYVHNCTSPLYENRYRFLLDNYVCKITQMSGEKCLQKVEFNHYLDAYINFIREPKTFLLKTTPKTLTTYNNIAYYLQKAGANKEAAYLLEKIIEKFPNRTVAYYNLGDVLGEKKKAIKAYTTYIEQMCQKSLQKKIPKVVLERIKVH